MAASHPFLVHCGKVKFWGFGELTGEVVMEVGVLAVRIGFGGGIMVF